MAANVWWFLTTGGAWLVMALQEAGTLAAEEEMSPYLAHAIPGEEYSCGQQGLHVS